MNDKFSIVLDFNGFICNMERNIVISEKLVIIAGIPLSEHAEPPSDQPGCELKDCPGCLEKMWVSELKRKMIIEEKGFLIGCWHCFSKYCNKIGHVPDMISSDEFLKNNN